MSARRLFVIDCLERVIITAMSTSDISEHAHIPGAGEMPASDQALGAGVAGAPEAAPNNCCCSVGSRLLLLLFTSLIVVNVKNAYPNVTCVFFSHLSN